MPCARPMPGSGVFYDTGFNLASPNVGGSVSALVREVLLARCLRGDSTVTSGAPQICWTIANPQADRAKFLESLVLWPHSVAARDGITSESRAAIGACIVLDGHTPMIRHPVIAACSETS